MKILLVHNFYREPGGEDAVFAQEQRLLESHGHRVIPYTRTNLEVEDASIRGKLRLLNTIVHAPDSRKQMAEMLRSEKPDVVHIHNTFMVISPSIYDACAEAGVPTVQTLHNYRLLCPAATMFRDGQVCEECTHRSLVQSVAHRCYRSSRTTTAAVALMLTAHRAFGTWTTRVNAFIALTQFSKRKFVENGLPAERVHVKPNFVECPMTERQGPGAYALFVGRLSPEKGVTTLLEAWKRLPIPVPLKIAGDGVLLPALRASLEGQRMPNVDFLGRQSRDQIRTLMHGARFLILPSLWYEGFPMVIAESFACGLAVLGSRLGAIEELIEDGQTGLHFHPGDPADLARVAAWAWARPVAIQAMGRNARLKFDESYSPSLNYERLVAIYAKAREQVRP
jgi:glycosyltransferase involved in cell wall biosynthesis